MKIKRFEAGLNMTNNTFRNPLVIRSVPPNQRLPSSLDYASASRSFDSSASVVVCAYEGFAIHNGGIYVSGCT